MEYNRLPFYSFRKLQIMSENRKSTNFNLFTKSLVNFTVDNNLLNVIVRFSIRGRLGSVSHLARNAGILIAYIVGTLLEYDIIPCIFVVIPIIFGICFSFLPNTPQFHLQKGNEQVSKLPIQSVFLNNFPSL